MNSENNPIPESTVLPTEDPQPVTPIQQEVTQAPPLKGKQKKKILLVLIVLVVVIAGLIEWRIVANEPSTLKLTQTDSKAYDKCFEKYSDKKLCQYYAIALDEHANRPVTTTQTVTIGIGAVSKYVLQTDISGNSRFTANGTLTEIIVGGQTFYRIDTGWTKTPPITVPDMSTIGLVYGNTFGIEGTNGSHAMLKYEGTIKCRNSTCYKYKDSYIPIGDNVYQTRYFWFDTKSYRLVGDSLTLMSSGGLTTVISNTRTYGPVPTITAPLTD